MARYAIGDIQGCYGSFQDLLQSLAFDEVRDTLWSVGDLVNRGPRSLEVLRWMLAHDEQVTSVLGNHEVRLLALDAGVVPERRAGDLGAILEAPDREDLLDWVRTRPLLHRQDPWLLVHAGLLPSWSIAEAEERARSAQAVLRGELRGAALASIFSGDHDPANSRPGDGLDPAAADAAATLSVLTTLRTCDRSGRLTRGHPGPPEDLPDDQQPWYSLPSQREAGITVLFGHWAALGVRRGDGFTSLDSGCVWGGKLSAVRLDDGQLFQVPPRPDEVRAYRPSKTPR